MIVPVDESVTSDGVPLGPASTEPSMMRFEATTLIVPLAVVTVAAVSIVRASASKTVRSPLPVMFAFRKSAEVLRATAFWATTVRMLPLT